MSGSGFSSISSLGIKKVVYGCHSGFVKDETEKFPLYSYVSESKTKQKMQNQFPFNPCVFVQDVIQGVLDVFRVSCI
jgi:hypothetical protein